MHKNKKGFSIIELMVVIAIMTIMVAVLFLKQGDRKAYTDVEAASRIVAAQIRELQNESLSGKKIGTGYANKYYFTLTNLPAIPPHTTTTYSISYQDSAGTDLGSAQTFDIATKKVKFKSLNPTFEFHFTAPSGNVSAGSVIEIVSNDNTVSGYICISKTGSVIEQNTSICP